MEREKGLEPSTFAMATRRSSQLSYSRLESEILSKGKLSECQVTSQEILCCINLGNG